MGPVRSPKADSSTCLCFQIPLSVPYSTLLDSTMSLFYKSGVLYITTFSHCRRLSFGCGSKPMVPFWGRCTTHFRTDFSGDWDVHWGYDLDFDPWPFI